MIYPVDFAKLVNKICYKVGKNIDWIIKCERRIFMKVWMNNK